MFITAAQTNVVVEARRSADSSVVASYTMGSNPSASNSMPADHCGEWRPIERSERLAGGGHCQYRGQGPDRRPRRQKLHVSDRGTIVEVDFGSLDSDGNGLPDVWEIQYFGHTGVDPNSMPRATA